MLRYDMNQSITFPQGHMTCIVSVVESMGRQCHMLLTGRSVSIAKFPESVVDSILDRAFVMAVAVK